MSGYIGNIPVPQSTQKRDTFTATAGQTSFPSSGYEPGYLDVYLNGVHLINGTDFTATNGTDVVLTTGASLDDDVQVVSYETFVVNRETPNDADTLEGNTASYFTSYTDTQIAAIPAPSFASLTSKPTTISGYGITDAFDGVYSSLSGIPSTFIPTSHTQAWSTITSTPTTLSGYGITDASTTTQMNSAISTAVSNLVDSAPGTLDTLNELAAALGDDPNFATTVTNNIATKLPLAGGTLTGNLDVGGTVTADGLTVDTSDQVIINHSATGGGIRIDSTNGTNTGSLRFGDVTDNYIGALEYNHTNDAMTMYVNNAERMRIDASGNVGIGTSSPEALLHLKSTSNTVGPSLIFENTNNGQSMNIDYYNNAGAVQSRISYAEGPASFNFIPNVTSSASALYIDYSGNVGIGTTSPSAKLEVAGNVKLGAVNPMQTATNVVHGTSGQNGFSIRTAVSGATTPTYSNVDDTNTGMFFPVADTLGFSTAGTERMRIDSSGNLLVGKTSTESMGSATAGHTFYGSGTARHTVNNGEVMNINRLNSDGDIIGFYKNGTTVGSISVWNGHIGLVQGGTRLEIDDGNDAVFFTNNSVGGLRDGTTDIGKTNARIKDVHAVNYYGNGSNLTGVGGSTAYGAVGTYIWAHNNTNTLTHNTTIAGSNLTALGAITAGQSNVYLYNVTSGSLSGTWRSLGGSNDTRGGHHRCVALFVRIS